MSTATHTQPDPRQVIADLGKDPDEIRTIELLSREHNHAIWQVTMPERSYVLKWLPFADAQIEIEGYRLLQKLGVPTLPTHGFTADALLLEDLARSDRWRLATQADTTRAETGHAVAVWYKTFHQAGEEFLSQGDHPSFLTRETNALNAVSLRQAALKLNLADSPVWELVIIHLELLKSALERLSFTLNYNDFYWTNLALSRDVPGQLEAVIFDYHLLGVGMRYSDCRNVVGSLSGAAVPAFWETYGQIDPREKVLDQPLSHLYTLTTASHMPEFPPWANESHTCLVNGTLQRDLLTAIDLSQQICSDSLL